VVGVAAVWAIATAGPVSATQQVTVIRAARVLDVVTGRLLRDRQVEVQADTVVAVRRWRPVPRARVVELGTATLLPGLIDLHTHLVGDIQSASPTAPLESTPEDDVLIGATNARKTLLAGFTTVRDVGTYRGLLDVALKRAIESGQIDGPRMSVAGAYLTKPGGGGEVTGLPAGQVPPPPFRMGVVATPAEAREAVRRLLEGGADFIKVIATGAVLTVGTEPGEIEIDAATLRAVVEEARRRGSYVTAHAHGAAGIAQAVRAGVRSIEHGSLLDDDGIALMASAGTWLVADIYNGDYIREVGRRDGWPEETMRKNEETTDAQRRAFRRAVRAGVPIGYGTDAGVYPHGDNAKQFRYLVEHGMTPLAAIRSATIEAARLMGWEGRVGAIVPGAKADLIAVPGNPLADVTVLERPFFVMKGGAMMRNDQ